MFQSHHKLFDSNIILLSTTGAISCRADLSNEDEEYIESVTTVANLPANLVTPSYVNYINRCYETA